MKIAYDNSVNNTDDDNSERTNGIAGRLRFFDIVALQEVWNDGPKDQLRAAIGDAYYLLPGPPASEDLPILDIPTDSGLLLLVRKCMAAEGDLAGVTAYSSELRLNHKEESFNETGGIFSADGWAAKGVTLDRIRLGSDHDHFVQVINTHTLAGTDTVVRASQLQQIRDFMNLHVDFSHPVILMGDLNIAEQLVGGNATMPLPGSEYESMFSNLLHFPVLGDLINVFGPPDPDQRFTDDTFRNAYARNWGDGVAIRERLDYILVRQHQNDPTTGATISIRYKIVDLLRPATVLLTDFGFLTQTCVTEGWLPDPLAPDLRCYLSDHFGIEAHLTFSETNEVPVADAGPDQTHSLSRFIISSPVTLNGTASRDPDGSPSPLTFAWTQTAGPAAILVGANTATLSFTPAVAETYKFSLVVSDGRASGSDDAIVTVTPPPFPILVDLQLPPAQPAPKPCPPFLLFCFNP
ncbi:MAG: endonuclease/exonuclease/phosphatase family protein [Chloroflexi bacterium]|nr:endonuclease/exonuclease/phosphatase family protein [Chloroflexota bacterium]